MRRALHAIAIGLLLFIPRAVPADEAKDDGSELTADEKQILELTNEARAKEKLPPLKVNPQLTKIARLHSANMAKKGEMKHVLDGKNPAQRALDGGYNYATIGENIATSNGVPIKDIMEGWMSSKVHRDNILQPRFEEIGIAIARNDKGDLYYTQLFGRPRKPR